MLDFKKIFYKYKDKDDFLVTFQNVKLTNETIITNHQNLKSYDWLKDRLGYYPIWTVKVTDHYRNNYKEFERLMGATLVTGRKYMYIIDCKKVEGFDTYLYAWCDVHSIENFGFEEELDEESKDRYDKDWIKYLSNPEYFKDNRLEIQTLIKVLNEDAIIECIENK